MTFGGRRLLSSKVILTVVLAGGSAMSFLLDWSGNHLLNPMWHPHARFHAAILLFFFAGVAATGVAVVAAIEGARDRADGGWIAFHCVLGAVLLCAVPVAAGLAVGRNSRT